MHRNRRPRNRDNERWTPHGTSELDGLRRRPLTAPGYAVATTTHRIGGDVYAVRGLLDRLQFWDPSREAERAGISSAAWPMFGLVWPAGLVLAETMTRFAFADHRILEVGCGLGLASLVLRRAGANITATDRHPLADEFLRFNAALNRIAPIAFRRAAWAAPDRVLGRFDVLIASDVLYEADHPDALMGFIDRHTNAHAEVIVIDPGRSQHARFGAKMRAEGYAQHDERAALPGDPSTPRARVMRFLRAPHTAGPAVRFRAGTEGPTIAPPSGRATIASPRNLAVRQ